MKTIYKKLFFFLLLLPVSMLAQSVSGTVTEQATGMPLPGASIVVQGTSNGTSSDIDGKFTLSGVKNGDVIVISSIGFTSQNVSYNGQRTLSIVMVEEASQLAEVVVQVGYGTVRKKDLTGSVTTVSAKDFNKGTMVTAENLINGKVAGVTINTSGAPGSGSQIRIRGGSSLFASNDPLIVIDGLPLDGNTNTGSTSFLATLNPADIESFTVLKDASATAIYGSRASNGVIIITTKKGGKTLAVDYNFQYGSGKLVKTIDVFSADRYRDMIATYNPGSVAQLGTANTNWQEAIYRNTTDLVDNSLSVRGSLFGVIPARVSIGNTYQEGLRLTNTFNRNSASVTLNPSLFKDHLKLRLTANYALEKNRFADGVEGAALAFDPTQPIYDPNSPFGGFFEYYTIDPVTGAGKTNQLAPKNPVAQLLQTNSLGRNNRIFGNFEVDYKFHFLPELRAVANLSFDEANGVYSRRVPAGIAASSGSLNDIPFGADEHNTEMRRNKLFDGYMVYNNNFTSGTMEFTAGYSYQKLEHESYTLGNQNDPNLPSNFPEHFYDTDVVLIGFFGRANVSIKDKYLLTLSYRRDGSSRFSEENRWGNFPAAAFAWRIGEEFFKGSKTISDLKLKLGYGITGQQNIPAANDYLQQYVTGDGVSQYYIGPLPVPIAVSARYSPDLKWEETTTYNVGLELGLWDNRITSSIDAFYKVSDDLLVDAAVPDGGNFSNRAWQNVGSFTTKGLEFSVDAKIIRSENTNLSVNFNATTFQRRIDELIYNADIFVGDNVAGTGTPGQILKEGYTPFSYFVYKQLYDENHKPIEGAYADINGDGLWTADDKYIYKNPDPDVVFGFSSTFNWKNLDFSFNARASIGNHLMNGVNAGNAQLKLLVPNGFPQNIPTSVNETEFTTTSNVLLSDLYIENASFLRMDNITLGYTFPKLMEGKASLRLSAGLQNAFVLTNYSGLDPEITSNVDKTIYPRQRSLLFGANVKF